MSSFDRYTIQMVIGSGCSGKTYVMVDIAKRIRDRDVFLFETKNRLTEDAFQILLNKSNCIILADTRALSIAQIKTIILARKTLEERNVHVVIFEDRNNRELSDLLKLLVLRGEIDPTDMPLQTELPNKLSNTELDRINPLLTSIGAGLFSFRPRTIVDNLMDISHRLSQKNKYYNKSPRFGDAKDIAVLISLAIEKKLYSSRVVQFDYLEQIEIQRRRMEPLVDIETTWAFEKSPSDPSPIKYVLHAEYWLCKELEKYASNQKNHNTIVKAYQYIVSKLIEHGAVVSLSYSDNEEYKDYTMFDNINRIFHCHGSRGISLVREIYDGLNELLSVDPGYMHQRAKCYIKSMEREEDLIAKYQYLDKAFRDSNVSRQILEARYDESGNQYLPISIAHVTYTQALILCHRCKLNEYVDPLQNKNAVEVLFGAMSSPYNSYDYVKNDPFNRDSIIEGLVSTLITQKQLVGEDSYSMLEQLFNLLRKPLE